MGLGSIAKSIGKVVSSAQQVWNDTGLGSVIDAVSPYIQGGLSYYGQMQTNSANAAEAQANRDFQERMRATQYQTAVDDMIKAGLNPMLAYQQGGAGNLSGSVSAPYQNALGQGSSTALAARQNIAQVKNMEAQNENLHEQTKLIPAQVAQAIETADFLHNQSSTEVFKALREKQGIELDKKRFELEKNLGATLAALQHAQSRNYDVSSAREAQRTYQEGLMTPVYEQDAEARKSPVGKVTRQTGTMLKDLGQIFNLFGGK